MKREEIIKMARDCDLGNVCGPLDTLLDYEWEALHRFANLVVASAQPQPCCGNFATCQQVCMPRAAAAEREECAKLCDGLTTGHSYDFDLGRLHSAKVIRARGTP